MTDWFPMGEVFPHEGDAQFPGLNVEYKTQFVQIVTPPIPPPEMEDAEEDDDD